MKKKEKKVEKELPPVSVPTPTPSAPAPKTSSDTYIGGGVGISSSGPVSMKPPEAPIQKEIRRSRGGGGGGGVVSQSVQTSSGGMSTPEGYILSSGETVPITPATTKAIVQGKDPAVIARIGRAELNKQRIAEQQARTADFSVGSREKQVQKGIQSGLTLKQARAIEQERRSIQRQNIESIKQREQSQQETELGKDKGTFYDISENTLFKEGQGYSVSYENIPIGTPLSLGGNQIISQKPEEKKSFTSKAVEFFVGELGKKYVGVGGKGINIIPTIYEPIQKQAITFQSVKDTIQQNSEFIGRVTKVSGGGFTVRVASEFIPTTPLDVTLYSAGGAVTKAPKIIQFGAGTIASFFGVKGVLASDLTPEQRVASGIFAVAGGTGAVYASGVPRRLQIYSEVRGYAAKLPKSERIEFYTTLKEAKSLRGISPEVKTLDLSRLKLIEKNVPAQEFLKDYVSGNKRLITGGSISQQAQFEKGIGGTKRPSDWDLYVKSSIKNEDVLKDVYAREIAKGLRGKGVKAQAQKGKVTVGGEKFIEIHPYETYLKPNIEAVTPLYYPARAGIVKTPEGAKILRLDIQAARKVTGFYLEPVISGKYRLKDLPAYEAIKKSLLITESKQAPQLFSAGIKEYKVLYHGTPLKNIPSILEGGIKTPKQTGYKGKTAIGFGGEIKQFKPEPYISTSKKLWVAQAYAGDTGKIIKISYPKEKFLKEWKKNKIFDDPFSPPYERNIAFEKKISPKYLTVLSTKDLKTISSPQTRGGRGIKEPNYRYYTSYKPSKIVYIPTYSSTKKIISPSYPVRKVENVYSPQQVIQPKIPIYKPTKSIPPFVPYKPTTPSYKPIPTQPPYTPSQPPYIPPTTKIIPPTTRGEKILFQGGLRQPKISPKKFTVSIRRFGKFKPIAITKTQQQAFNIGKQATAKTLGATFKVEGAGVKQPFKIPKYRTKKTKEGILFIEQPKFRLSTGTEKKEIQYFKKLKGGIL